LAHSWPFNQIQIGQGCEALVLARAFNYTSGSLEGQVRVIHPFHPLAGQEFELVS
jgi:hypothetical protein